MEMIAGWLKRLKRIVVRPMRLAWGGRPDRDAFPDDAYVLPCELDVDTEEGLCEVPEWAMQAFLPHLGAAEVAEAEVPGDLHWPDDEPDGPVSNLPAPDATVLFLEDLLLSFGHKCTGINIDAHVPDLVKILSATERERLARECARLDETKAVDRLVEALLRQRLSPRKRALLKRLQAVLRYGDEDLPLPRVTKRMTPGSLEDGPVFYLAHMADPYINNGYVSRTRFILRTLKEIGADPHGVMRLGFPQEFARFRNEPVHRLRTVDGMTWHMLPDSKRGQYSRPLDDYVRAYADSIVELARRYDPVVLHAASNHLNGLAAVSAARRLGLPCIYEVRGLWEITRASLDRHSRRTVLYRQWRRLENQATKNADVVITISEPLKDFLISEGVREERIFVVPNGVDTSRFTLRTRDHALARKMGIGKDKVVIGYVGSIVPYEGLDLLLEAMARLKPAMQEKLHLLIVGDGVALPSLQQQAEALGIAGICTFTGRVPFEEVPKFYSLIDIAPFPRRSLPVTELVPPLKPFEAMAMQKAVVVSSVRALQTNVIPGRTALVFEKDDTEQLSACLRELVENDTRRRKLAAQAYSWVNAERTIPALATHMAAAYERLGVRGLRVKGLAS